MDTVEIRVTILIIFPAALILTILVRTPGCPQPPALHYIPAPVIPPLPLHSMLTPSVEQAPDLDSVVSAHKQRLSTQTLTLLRSHFQQPSHPHTLPLLYNTQIWTTMLACKFLIGWIWSQSSQTSRSSLKSASTCLNRGCANWYKV